MDSYVKNVSNNFIYALQRHWAPNHTISLEELYSQYGEKHGLEYGPEFIAWLLELKLVDRSKWQIVYNGKVVSSLAEVNKLGKPQKEVRKMQLSSSKVVFSDTPIDFESEIVFPGEKSVKKVEQTDGSSSEEASPAEKPIDSLTGKPVNRQVMTIKRRVPKGPGEKKRITAEDILNLKAAEMKETIKNIKDIRVLRRALQEAESRRNTATLCKLLKERINQLKYKSY